MVHNLYIWYPWYTVLISGTHDAQHPFMSSIHEMEYLYLVSMIHNTYVNYPWCNIIVTAVHDTQYFMSGIHDIHCLCLVSLMHIVSVCYPRHTIYIYAWITCLVACIVDLVHQIFPYLISAEVETMVYFSQSRHEICDYDPPTSCPISH